MTAGIVIEVFVAGPYPISPVLVVAHPLKVQLPFNTSLVGFVFGVFTEVVP